MRPLLVASIVCMGLAAYCGLFLQDMPAHAFFSILAVALVCAAAIVGRFRR